MNEEFSEDLLEDSFQIDWHGDTIVITAASTIERMNWDLIEQSSNILLEPLSEVDIPMIVFDLSKVNAFGSVFMSLLLRCHKLAKSKGGELVVAGPSQMARALLGMTSLDTLWAIYDTREEAIAALAG